MSKLLSLIVISLVWFTIGWFSRGIYQPKLYNMFTLSSEEQRILKAQRLLQSRQLLLNHPGENPSVSEKLAGAAIAGMLRWSQDKYADLYGPFATERYLAGYENAIGITDLWFDVVDGQRIVTVLPADSPASLAGVEVGDILLRIDGFDFSQSVGGYEISTLLRGPVGSAYELTFQRGDKIIKRTVTRKRWDYLSNQLIHGDIGYLKTEYFFADHTEKAVKTILNEFAKENVQAIIWDLRNNTGGSPAVAETIMSAFRTSGSLLYSVEFKDGTRRAFTAQGATVFAAIPIVVLINEQTWSAGEIAAAAMAERENTVLIGVTTAGKGVIQDTIQLDQTHMLHFTVAKWLTPTGKWIHEKGVHPNTTVEEDLTTMQDEVLEAAIGYMNQVLGKN